MKKLLIFDLDGTLADTRPLLNYIFADSLTECGIPETEEHVREPVRARGFQPTQDGGQVPVDYSDKVPDDFGFYFWIHYENYYMRAVDRLYDGIRETLDALKARGHVLAVLSNKPHRFTEHIINAAFGKDYFDFVLGGTTEITRKPSPTGIRHICKMLGFAHEDAYMVGDLPADAIAASSASVNYIGALWGYSSRETLEEKGGKLFAKTPADILNII